MLNITRIPAPRVALVDSETGLMSREWFRFFNNIYTIVGANLGVIQIENGGTGLSTAPTNGQLLIGDTVNGYVLNTLNPADGITVTNGAGTITLTNTGVLSFSGGNTGLTPATATNGNVVISGLLNVASGGTNQSSYVDGELLIGNTTGNTLTKSTLTAGTGLTITNGNGAITPSITATGVTALGYGSASNVGTFTVNAQGQLTTAADVSIAINGNQITSGNVSVLYGGTGQTSYTDGQLLIGNSTGNTLTKATLTAGSGVTINNSAGAITINATGSGGTVTSITAGTGLTGGTITTTGTIAIDSTVTTLTGTQTLTNKTLTAPKIDLINDTNGNEILGFSPTASATDYLVVKNGIGVGVPLHLYADGSSANTGVHIQPKGTGLVTISDGTDFSKGIRFRSSSSAASAITLLDAVSSAGRVVTLPDATTTLVGRDTTDTLTNKSISGATNTLSSIGNASLTNSTISGVALGGSLFNLTAGTGVSFSTGTTYNGSAAITINATGTGGTVTSVAALTLGTTGTDLSSTVANGTTTPVITLNVPTASAANRGALSAADWTTFNNKSNTNGTVTSVSFTGGIVSVATATTTPALTVAGTSGGIPYFSSATTWATSAALTANSLVQGGGAGVAPSTITTGTGVITALGVNTNTAGSFVVYNNALGTPSSGTVTNLTGTASININGTVGATTPTTGVFTTATANSFIPNSATVPTNGMYLSAANTLGFSTASTSRVTIDASGFVNMGIGVASTYYLNVLSGGSGAVRSMVRIGTNGNGGAGRGCGILIGASGSSNTVDVAQIVGFQNTASATANNAALAFQVANAAGTLTESMRLFNSGSVSIGNTTDKGAASLNVSGLIYPQQATTAGAPAYVKGAIYFDTTLNKLRVGGATAWETITSV